MYGNKVHKMGGRRDVIGAVEQAPVGNVVIRIGEENLDTERGDWFQKGHVVLTPEEALELAELIRHTARRPVVRT